MAQITPGVDHHPAPLSCMLEDMLEVATQMETGATSVKQHRRSASLDTSAEDHQTANSMSEAATRHTWSVWAVLDWCAPSFCAHLSSGFRMALRLHEDTGPCEGRLAY